MIKEDMKWLSQFESNFRTAIHSNYSRNVLESQLRRMVEIYEKETGKRYSLCYHCSTQVLYFLKDMGKLYYDVLQGRNYEAVQAGNETVLTDKELEKTVTDLETKTKNNDEAIEQRKNNTTTNTKKNGKHSSRKGK